MNSRKLSLIAVALLLVGTQLMYMGSGSHVSTELPLEPPTANAFATFTLPSEMPRYDIPLTLHLQKYIYEKCQKYGLAYEMVLAVIKAESNFVIDVVGVTGDLGLMQLNPRNTVDWLAKKLNLDFFDPLDPYQNVAAGIWYLAHIRDYWIQYTDCQQKTFALTLLSYNRGINGATRYVKQHGLKAFNNSYVEKVSAFKQQFEEGR